LEQRLQDAIKNKNTSLVQELLHQGANIESRDANGDTPLMLATENADITMMKLLLKNNTNVEATNKNGETALVNAARGDDVDVVKTLIEKVSDGHDQEQALLAASENGPDGILHISSDPHLNEADEREQITEMPEVAIVKLLLDHNIGIETRDYDGSTPLILAASHGQIEIVQLLLNRGARVDARDNYGNTALTASACACAQATMRPTHDILGLLLDRNAKIDAQSNDGSTALMNAARGFELENTELLINRGANLRIKDKKGKTALQWAHESDRSDAEQILKKALAAHSTSI
jgi:ankyrin repeat protein